MSIKSRLTVGVAILLVVVFVAMGVVMARSARATLTDQVDDDVREQSIHLTSPKKTGNQPQGNDQGAQVDTASPQSGGTPLAVTSPVAGNTDSDEYGENRRSIATFIYTADGSIRDSRPSGYSDDPDSPPELPAFGSPEFQELTGRIVTLPSEDGSIDYRVLIQPGRIAGDIVVVAESLSEVDTAVRNLIERFVAIGLAGLLIAAAASWWVIQRELRPVDQMIDTASAIAGGDLSRRVPENSQRTELGMLGGALNEMLGQIEESTLQREANQQRLRRFVADAAHELRTPLTSVRGYAELYRQGAYPDSAAVDHAMSRIESEGGRMARLVEDLLLLARMDQQRGLEQRPLDLVSLASEAVADFEAVSTDHPVTWQPKGEVLVRGDRIRLRHVIDNLLGNARMHTPTGTEIDVSVRSNNGNAELVIADNGPGIQEEDRARVFERFWRADRSRTRNTGGAGLGLAIVESLVQAHGGTVQVESTPGQRTAFTIRLPVISTAQ
jgi:two-component system, OmpR family, sensor kinase